MSSSTNISIRDLAAYCLDYSRLVSGNATLSRGPRIELGKDVVDISNLIFGNYSQDDDIFFEFKLITSIKHDVSMPDEFKTPEQKEAEKQLKRDKEILEVLTDINNKIKTQEYTKNIILETGIVKFNTRRVENSFFSRKTTSSIPENIKTALFQIPVTIDLHPQKDVVNVKITVTSPYIKFAIEPLNNFLKQQYYDEIFELITSYDAEEKNALPISKKTLEDIWATIRTKLSLMDATDVSDSPDLSFCTIRLSAKTNYFLAEDLNLLANMDDSDMEKSSLGAWSSDENMNEQYDVFDDGRTEIFFPFQYDKYQLKVLGIIDNKASIIEGPPGTGKSQTIANILCHLAATGKKVLFVSQKDQAVRGVKDKLKSLDIPFLFGYIPDRTSRLYTEEDEKDSAVNTLKSFQKTFIKEAISDQKEPLRLISNEQKIFSDGVNNERNLFDYYTQRRALDYVKPYATLDITREWWKRYDQLWNQANQLTSLVKNYQKNNLVFMKKEASALRGINVDCNVINDFLARIINEFNEIIPERSGTLKALFIHNKMNSALKRHGKTIIQEIYLQAENIIFSEQTKSARLKDLQELKNYFKNRAAAEKVSVLKTELLEMLAKKGMSQEQADNLRNIITQKGLEDVFSDMEEYINLTEEIDNIECFSANEINQEIKELQKYYKTNVCNYIRNRILKQIDAVNSQKSTKAILNRVANSLSKGRKAYKTFDKLKNGEDGPDNFRAMSEAIPIWMISLEDVNRIIPMVANAFDYVILDEASQCNLAYSLPVMYRARHTVFFGDSLQMRDTNTLFKSNQQLEAIAKKNKISEYYQIKATEDSVKSVMDIATLAGFKTAVLRYHYRSPKELIGFSNENFYKAVGRSLEVVNDNILTFKDTNRVLINHVIEAPNENEDSGKRNYAEVEYIKGLIKELKSNPKTKDKSIAVLTFFNEQAELLRQSIEDEDVKVSVIEGIQGDERDIIIYSFVIRDPSEKKRYIALTGEGGDIRKGAAEGRVNVAFSRARLQVHCVTSLKPELWPEGIWIKKYLEYVDKNGIPERHNDPSRQIFDSGFEEEVFKKIAASLDNRSYSIETQVKSCGFRIDLVISNKKNAKKLAIECDGPTHFEDGDGQVYVKDDWERQMVLETAGWHFYRISYFDWMEERDETLRDTLKYIHDYLDDDSNIPLSTPNSIKMLRANRIMPEEEKRNIYVTHFENSSEKSIIPPATQANNTVSTSTQAPISTIKIPTCNPVVSPRKPNVEFTVGNKQVNQSEFEQYLRRHNGSTITIRYQSTRKDSASKWRYIPMEKYDSVYIYARHEDGYFIRYRRDRVVEYK